MKRTPLLGPVWGGDVRATTAEWTIPGPSTFVQPMFPGCPVGRPTPPLTQLIISRTVWLKLAATRFGVMVKLEGLTAVGSVLTIMSQPLNGSRFATFTW